MCILSVQIKWSRSNHAHSIKEINITKHQEIKPVSDKGAKQICLIAALDTSHFNEPIILSSIAKLKLLHNKSRALTPFWRILAVNKSQWYEYLLLLKLPTKFRCNPVSSYQDNNYTVVQEAKERTTRQHPSPNSVASV